MLKICIKLEGVLMILKQDGYSYWARIWWICFPYLRTIMLKNVIFVVLSGEISVVFGIMIEVDVFSSWGALWMQPPLIRVWFIVVYPFQDVDLSFYELDMLGMMMIITMIEVDVMNLKSIVLCVMHRIYWLPALFLLTMGVVYEPMQNQSPCLSWFSKREYSNSFFLKQRYIWYLLI